MWWCLCRLWTCGLVVGALVWAAAEPGLGAVEPPKVHPPREKPSAEPSRPAPSVFDEPVEPLTPKTPRSEADQLRLKALSLYSAARAEQQRQEWLLNSRQATAIEVVEGFGRALRLYQRALQYDPQAPVLDEIIALGLTIGRIGEVGRYALLVKTDELRRVSPRMLRQVAICLVEIGERERAIAVFEEALAAGDGGDDEGDLPVRREIGRLCFILEDFDKAADQFARVLDALNDPKAAHLTKKTEKELLGERPAATYQLFGLAFLEAKRFGLARSAFRKAHEVSPNEPRLLFNLARADARADQSAEALEKLDQYFATGSESEDIAPYELLAEVLEKLGKSDSLDARLEKLRQDNPDNVPLRYFIAQRHFEAGRLDKAEALYRKLIEQSPEITGYDNLVEIYKKADRPAALLKVLGQVAEKTGALDPLGEKVEAILKDEKLVNTLIETARRTLEGGPDTLPYGQRLAAALLAVETKQYETASEFFELAVQVKSEKAPELMLLWGLALLFGEEYGDAADVFRRGVQLNKDPDKEPVFYYYLAGALAMDKRTDKAVDAARKAIELRKESAQFLSRLGWIYYRDDQYEEAEKVYRELIEEFEPGHADEENREVLRETRLVLSNICVLTDRFPEAEEFLQQVLDEYPEDISALNDLGYLWADEGKRLRQARKMIEKAVRGEPDNIAYRDSLGWVLYRLGRFKRAVAELEKAAAGEDPDALILDHLGDAYHKNNQPDKARDAWRRAAELYEKEEEPQKAEKVREKIKDQEPPPPAGDG